MKYFVNDLVFDQLKMNAYHQDFNCNFAIINNNPTETKVINTNKVFFCQKKDHFFGKKKITKSQRSLSSVFISNNYLLTFLNFNNLLTNVLSQNLKSILIENNEFLIDYNQDENIFITKNIIFSTNLKTVSISFLFDDYSIEIHNYHSWIHIRKVFTIKDSILPSLSEIKANH